MKFRPGYRPILYTFNFITDHALFYPTQVQNFTLVQDGAQLIIETIGVDPRSKSGVTCNARLVVSYDAARNLYTYDPRMASSTIRWRGSKMAGNASSS